jgi:erythromycin esterase
VEKLTLLTSLPAAESTLMRDRAAQALALIEAHRGALIAASTPQEYRDALQAARILAQLTRACAGTVFVERDAAMAENVRWLIEEAFPGQKIVLWAHNGHVSAAPNGGEKMLGGHLRDCYGDQMVVIGFALHHGAIRAKRIADGKFQPGPPTALPLCSAKPTSVEALFNETGLPRFILDLRRIPEGDALGRWLAGTRPHRSIGAGHDPDHDNSYSHVNLPAEYDAIVFIAESSAAKPLREQAA